MTSEQSMDLKRTIAAAVVGLASGMAMPAPASAQEAVAVSRPAEVASPATPSFDVERLPINLQRIYRELQLSATREEREGLNLRYVIDVFGRAPSLAVFTREDNLLTGPVPHGAPTHREMIEHVTPREYRAPAADFGALIRWLAERANK